MNKHYAGVAERAGHRCEFGHAPEAVFNLPFTRSHGPPWECLPRRSASSGLRTVRTQSVPDGIPTEDRSALPTSLFGS